MEWLEKLQAPGLLLAGLVIWWLFQLLKDRDRQISEVAAELKAQNVVLSKIATLMDLICRRTPSQRSEIDGGQ
jgi:hypothetical protein